MNEPHEQSQQQKTREESQEILRSTDETELPSRQDQDRL
jgi:hypothetical protein